MRHRRRRLASHPQLARIETLAHDGRGLAHVNERPTFIHGALPGEQVLFRETGRRSRQSEGVTLELVADPSPHRIDPRCIHYAICGGCALQHLDPRQQILTKQDTLLQNLQRIGKVAPEEILPPLQLDSPWGYRRKARLGVKHVRAKGRVLVGFRERGSPYVADLSRCEVLHPQIGELLPQLSELIAGLSVHDQLPQIELAMGDQDCILILRLLADLTSEDLHQLHAFEQRHGLRFWTQRGGPETVQPLGEEDRGLVYALPDWHLELRFLPQDFTQVNHALNRLMVNRALELLAVEPEDRVLDLFCGLGNFTLPLARKAQEVTGVEGDAGLVERARLNASANGIHNTRYFTADLYQPLDHEPWLQGSYARALLDPPRSGAFEVLEWLPRLGVERLVYVSCYPSTLARDAGELVHRHGYRLLKAGVMDMFPHTSHVESIALFVR